MAKSLTSVLCDWFLHGWFLYVIRARDLKILIISFSLTPSRFYPNWWFLLVVTSSNVSLCASSGDRLTQQGFVKLFLVVDQKSGIGDFLL